MSFNVTKTLMGETTTLGDIDDIKVAGRYGFATDGSYEGMAIFGSCTLLDVHVVGGVVVQTIIKNPMSTVPGTWKAIRSYVMGSWTPWEFDFPPMAAGVEYRTRENFQNKPVYAKLFNCGDCGPGTTMIGITGSSQNLVRYSIINAPATLSLTYYNSFFYINNSSSSALTNVRCILYYTKE